MLEASRNGLDWHYVGVSPQLLARVRLNWSAQGLDLDAFWRESIQRMPGFRDIEQPGLFQDSRPVDLLLLFDQGCIWVDSLRRVCLALAELADGGSLAIEQVRGLAAVTTRLREELAAVRTLALSGLALPAMQISRSISEDVDLGLALLVRRKIAQAFVECQGPEDAAEFWRRHVAGGRSFRLVAQALYRFGLDYSEDSDYVRWRKEVLVFLGSAVHTSFPGQNTDRAGEAGLNPTAQECLNFATIRVQEMCAYAMVLGRDLRRDLERLPVEDQGTARRARFLRTGGEIIIDQMRWLTGGPGTASPSTRTPLN